ncbi:MAG: hypothetical protein MJ198_10880 [Bacteroidales bacterium]|nr:hypothetical protein [Bacteroidales bacterium]
MYFICRMKRYSEAYNNLVEMVRNHCNQKYNMNLEDLGELKRLRKLLDERLSLSTLQRVFMGTNRKQQKVNDTTLDILAQFIGYNNIDDCLSKNNEQNSDLSHFC